MNAASTILARLVVGLAWGIDRTVLPVVDRVMCRWANVTAEGDA